MQSGLSGAAARPERARPTRWAALLCGAAAAFCALPALAETMLLPEAPTIDLSRPVPESFSLSPLSAKDVRAYKVAFAATRDGRFEAAAKAAATVSDPTLLGRLAFAKLMHPDYRSSFGELSDWMERYGDQPGADRIYALAMKRRPDGAPAPRAPRAGTAGGDAIWARVEALAERYEASAPAASDDDDGQAAREAFYGGDVEKAQALAKASGERWIEGLSTFRMGDYAEARRNFAALAEDGSKDEWVRSAGAYWAARAAIAAGAPEAAPQYLAVAARTPYTFYGLIAERQLGLEPAITAEGLAPDYAAVTPVRASRTSVAGGPDGAAVARLVRSDRRARRAAALAQLGLQSDAGAELRAGLAGAGPDSREAWARLSLALNAPLTSSHDLSRRARFDIDDFPTPELSPQGGFTLNKALVYALVRQESRFRANAAGPGGAYGLMQLMPATAARVAGDAKLRKNPSRLKDPGLNLKLGQTYVSRLLGALDGDLLHAVAAYNSGPANIQKTLSSLGRDADSLLAIESMPGAKTRDYVEKVVAGYWIYRNIFGMDSPTLDAAASAKKAISAALDQPAAVATAALDSFLSK